MPAARSHSEDLTDAVYRAALEPQAWDEVMQAMRSAFPSQAQTFYLLHMQPHRIQPVSLAGIEPRWVRNFDELYFAADNPWIRMSRQLHRPGIVRTNERLDRVLRRRGALYRSAYYNDWIKPQGFKYTIGNTLLSEGGIVANITLLRAPEIKTFSAAEVHAFDGLSRHMTRALQMSIRLDCIESCATHTAVLDALPQPAAIVSAQRQLLHANAAMEALLRRGQGLQLRQGRLQATQAEAQPLLAACIAAPTAAGDLRLPCGEHSHLSLKLVPLPGRLGRSLMARPTVLLLASEEVVAPQLPAYALTPGESRLASLLVQGRSLRQAADLMGISYGTARAYLKVVFHKIGVHSQAQLVSRLFADAPRPS
jgi:DNA-binding CsgD family transcriptional regulator/PAS domain-containing protein